MLNKLTESPLTLAGGMLCAIGMIMLVVGLLFDKEAIWQAGMGLIGTGGTLIGVFARDNAASQRRATALQHEIQTVKGQAVRDAEDAAVKVVEEKAAIRK